MNRDIPTSGPLHLLILLPGIPSPSYLSVWLTPSPPSKSSNLVIQNKMSSFPAFLNIFNFSYCAVSFSRECLTILQGLYSFIYRFFPRFLLLEHQHQKHGLFCSLLHLQPPEHVQCLFKEGKEKRREGGREGRIKQGRREGR